MTISRYGLSTCSHCGQPIRWSITEAGKRQPLNPEPDEAGNTVARLTATRTWYSRVPTAEYPKAPFERRFMPHAATCTALQPSQLALPAPPANVVRLNTRRRQPRR